MMSHQQSNPGNNTNNTTNSNTNNSSSNQISTSKPVPIKQNQTEDEQSDRKSPRVMFGNYTSFPHPVPNVNASSLISSPSGVLRPTSFKPVVNGRTPLTTTINSLFKEFK